MDHPFVSAIVTSQNECVRNVRHVIDRVTNGHNEAHHGKGVQWNPPKMKYANKFGNQGNKVDEDQEYGGWMDQVDTSHYQYRDRRKYDVANGLSRR